MFYQPSSLFKTALRKYFYSGWAFLLPYLFIYLFYYLTEWPVNPHAIPTDSSSKLPGCWVPSLLHAYWFLHAAHVILAVTCWLPDRCSRQNPAEFVVATSSAKITLLPWIFIALIIYIPGIYLEWPSDPWEHLRRINEWHAHNTVADHSTWQKSSYILPYSLTGHTSGLTQLRWLNFYYTGICLLLCWQYYRLARAMKISESASLVFVLLQVLLMGNNVFSFYRYYGLSTTIVAQLGAVALTRVSFEFLRPKDGESRLKTSHSGTHTFSRLTLLGPLSAALLLFLLIACNHIQGIGIAGLSILAIGVWRLIEWKRFMIFWLGGVAIALSVLAVLCIPRHPALDEIYFPQGWLTAWYGLNLFSPISPAFARSLQIIGLFGVINLFTGIWLVARQNHVVGWLTLMPVIILSMPFFSLPFIHVLVSQNHTEYIIIFQRMLLAIPIGLALVTAAGRFTDATVTNKSNDQTASLLTRASHFFSNLKSTISSWPRHKTPTCQLPSRFSPRLGTWSVTCLLLFLVVVPPGAFSYNRFWQSTQITPDDLQLRRFTTLWNPANLVLASDNNTAAIISPLGNKIRETFSSNTRIGPPTQIHAPILTAEFERKLFHLSSSPFFSEAIRSSDQLRRSRLLPDLMTVPLPLPSIETRGAHLIADLTAANSPWLALGGEMPESVATSESTIISNPTGKSSQTFRSALIPIDPSRRYQLVCTVRQSGSASGTNYLAVAWYDQNGTLLVSTKPYPQGAGAPAGWANGTFSYYGLVNQPAPAVWTQYTISFGSGENAAIPVNAAYFRVGALLNYNEAIDVKSHVKRVTLLQKQNYKHLLLALPAWGNLYSPGSTAARLSGHWAAQQAAVEHAGTTELRSLVLSKFD